MYLAQRCTVNLFFSLLSLNYTISYAEKLLTNLSSVKLQHNIKLNSAPFIPFNIMLDNFHTDNHC